MSGFELSALILLGGLAWFWLASLKAREAAMRGARAACQREGVQLLDETVACRSLRLDRDEQGRATLARVYDFEYSDSGVDRHRGSLMLNGQEVVMLDVSAHRRVHTLH
ncbi:DUF3301 domain-containing protein [Pseudothauera nasutitermitis]|uniref:DUF3301 domain-containing protein n=1 Tax=Pseudothauera nasutitermitis TaxID=2565930 RepID=A0A4S4B116_9RHOO|nr:DUF3301 domain-containing protein [Pseudothauera nasutitermitis]THF66236.1 DUF3301 domain-containing protein [Pseudothauera nasutitermitis]